METKGGGEDRGEVQALFNVAGRREGKLGR